MKTIILTVAVIITSLSGVNAQSNNHLELEIDPLAYSLGGASGHLGYTFKNERIFLGYGQLTLPEGMQTNKNVSESFKAISFKWEYFFGREDASKGFFAGPSADYMFLTYEDEMGNITKDDQLNLGIRAGCKFDLFKKSKTLKGMYLTPWISASWLTKPGEIRVGDQNYERKSFNIFPTVHLGWSF